MKHVCALSAASALLCASANAQSYSASIEGAGNGLKDKLTLISELMKGVRDYPTNAALRRAAKRDVDAFNNALRAAGYYAGSADFTLIAGENDAKPRIVYTITTGPAFKITDYEILYQDEGENRPTTLDDAKVKADESADGASLRDAQQKFLTFLWNNGYPSAEIISRRAIADYEAGEASAIYVFKSGPKARFGEIQIEGAKKTDRDFIVRLKTWEDGEEFERKKMTQYYDRLNKTGLFAKIEISPGETAENGETPIIVELTERKQRTFGAGVSYSTSEGPGGRLFLEHRSIFGHNETFRAEIKGSELEQSVDLTISRPMPRIGGQAFAGASFANETTDAYNARSFELTGGLSKKWINDHLETRGAIALETSSVRANGMEERTYFVSTPLTVAWNSEDSPLDPSRGFRAAWTVTPYTGSDTFTQMEISGRGRLHLGPNKLVTLAARSALGATFNTSFNDLPLNKRYYAGGGGSVRGYGYQEAGPLDADNDPVGGLSRIEGAFEARVKVIKNVQIAGFVDAGSVSSKSVPDFTDEYFIGYGAGIRYLTPIGPIRADIAFPLDKRPTDSGFQIYIALGQPF